MDDQTIRFGTHAAQIRDNGFGPLIPTIGKRPAIANWSEHVTPTDPIEFSSWLSLYPGANIATVMDGRLVVVDIDILDEALVEDIVSLADERLGPTDFRRVGRAPKIALFFRADGPIPTSAGGKVEVFSTPGSKQVLLFGRHPDTGADYQWIDLKSPLTHRFEELPRTTAEQVAAFRKGALELVAEAGLYGAEPSPQGSAPGPSNDVSGVGEMMTEVLREMGGSRADPLPIAASYFEQAPDGSKHYAMVAAVGALVLRGYSDQEIIDAFLDAYQRRVPNDPSLRNLMVCPGRVRRGLLRRGAVLPDSPLPIDRRVELDDDQRIALSRARRRLHDIFDGAPDRIDAAKRVTRFAARIRDDLVLAALAPAAARRLALDGWPEAELVAATELFTGRSDVGLARWAIRSAKS